MKLSDDDDDILDGSKNPVWFFVQIGLNSIRKWYLSILIWFLCLMEYQPF